MLAFAFLREELKIWEQLTAFDCLQVTVEVALLQAVQLIQSPLAQSKMQVYHQGLPPDESSKMKIHA